MNKGLPLTMLKSKFTKYLLDKYFITSMSLYKSELDNITLILLTLKYIAKTDNFEFIIIKNTFLEETSSRKRNVNTRK